jgi:outer membrane protein assembly factor BamA
MQSVDYEDSVAPSFLTVDNGWLLSFVHDEIARVYWEPTSGWGARLSIEDYEKLLQGSRQYDFYRVQFQSYWGLGSGPWRETVLGLNLDGRYLDGDDVGGFYMGGNGVLRGVPEGEQGGRRMVLGTLELRTPMIKEINYSFPFFDALLFRDLYFSVFTDNGYVWNDTEMVTSGKVRNSVGTGLRLAAFVLQYYPLLLRFDVAKRTDTSYGPIYYFSLGEMF